ncbi:hypothetical protein A9Q99_02630 [Gammaproteobacteria bacterium 45_16_T64]|nr:hypothetical protein A9Q99_02630 [Gammaproteobacteria bacterium 45_16_T64]
MQQEITVSHDDDMLQKGDISLRELWAVILGGGWLIIGLTSIFTIAFIFYAMSVPDEYRSTALLSPASASDNSSLAKLAGQFGGLASLAGVGLSSGGSDKTTIAIELLKTWGFLEEFIRSNQLEKEVYAVKGWDSKTNTLLINEELYDVESNKWVAGGPSSWDLFNKLNGRVSVSQNKNTGLISMSVEHYSPTIAREWVDKLVVSINRYIQSQDRKDAQSRIRYLKEQIDKTNVAEMQAVFYQLIEEQTKTLMLAEISDEYVFKTLSPAMIPAKKFKPKRTLVVIFGGLVGLGMGVCLTLLLWFIRQGKAEGSEVL